jgi:hypothetical protein
MSEESKPIRRIGEDWHEGAEWQIRRERAAQFLREYTEEGEGFHIGSIPLKHHYFSWCRSLGLVRTEYGPYEILHVLSERSLLHYEPSTSTERQKPATVLGMRMKRTIGLPRYYKTDERKPLSNTVKAAVWHKLRSNGNVCALCGRPILADDTVHIDHILPVRKGGTDDPSNLQVVHDRCNLTKG